MTTKYAKARDVAGQWKSELRKVQRENRSLRRVYVAARDLNDEIALHALLTSTRPPGAISDAVRSLKDALRNAVFAEPPSQARSARGIEVDAPKGLERRARSATADAPNNEDERATNMDSGSDQ